MPELPEVECLTRALRGVLEGGRINAARFLRKDLRAPIPITKFQKVVVDQTITAIFRRSKYLLMQTARGYGVVHLGMTGNLLRLDEAKARHAHTHAIFRFVDRRGGQGFLHFVDPRRFGSIDCIDEGSFSNHASFAKLGPEPLDTADLGRHLFERSRNRTAPVKSFIMDAHVVVGVGNIYASEALFGAGIHPSRPAGSVSLPRYQSLASAIQATLAAAIAAGGTSFRDFRNTEGEPGYFSRELQVYDRVGLPCVRCAKPLMSARHAGRSSFFCGACQS